jgi:hypothetical protein
MAEEQQMFRCDTCGKETPTVSRVVVDAGYDRSNARPKYNCPECYQKKLDERLKEAPEQSPSAP